jgi:mRNA interferase MazF
VFGRTEGEIALDQIRAVDKTRLARRLGAVQKGTARAVCATLVEMLQEAGE